MTQIKKILQIVIPLALAALLFWWVYKDMDFTKLSEVLRSGLNYGWIIVSILLSTLSNIIRGLRWNLLLQPVCPGAKNSTSTLAVFISYAVNLIFPRAGEVARCGIMHKYNGASFTRSLGTVITERVFDSICLVLIAALAILLQMGFFADFFDKNPQSLEKLVSLITSPYIWGSLLFVVVLVLILRNRLKATRFYDKIKSMLVKLFEGMKSITTMKKPLLFIFYTISIWGIYFLMFYIGKLFFPFDIELGLLPLLSGFVMGTLGILAPVQGGIGAYHFMVIYTFVFYGVSEQNAAIFALVIHGLQTLVSLFSGLIAWILLNNKGKKYI